MLKSENYFLPLCMITVAQVLLFSNRNLVSCLIKKRARFRPTVFAESKAESKPKLNNTVLDYIMEQRARALLLRDDDDDDDAIQLPDLAANLDSQKVDKYFAINFQQKIAQYLSKYEHFIQSFLCLLLDPRSNVERSAVTLENVKLYLQTIKMANGLMRHNFDYRISDAMQKCSQTISEQQSNFDLAKFTHVLKLFGADFSGHVERSAKIDDQAEDGKTLSVRKWYLILLLDQTSIVIVPTKKQRKKFTINRLNLLSSIVALSAGGIFGYNSMGKNHLNRLRQWFVSSEHRLFGNRSDSPLRYDWSSSSTSLPQNWRQFFKQLFIALFVFLLAIIAIIYLKLCISCFAFGAPRFSPRSAIKSSLALIKPYDPNISDYSI